MLTVNGVLSLLESKNMPACSTHGEHYDTLDGFARVYSMSRRNGGVRDEDTSAFMRNVNSRWHCAGVILSFPFPLRPFFYPLTRYCYSDHERRQQDRRVTCL